MRFLSVATFAHPDHFGGAERVITTVAEGLVARGHEVTLLTGRIDAGRPERERRAGVDVVRYPVVRGSPATFYRSVWRGVRAALSADAGADVVHVHQLLSGLAALAPGGCPSRPRLFSFYAPYHLEYLARYRRGWEDGRVPAAARGVAAVLRRADRWLLRRADAIVVLSDFSRRQIVSLAPEAAGRATLAPAGVDLERFAPARDESERRRLARSFGLPDEVPLVVSVRRLVPRMGLGDLVEAAGLLARSGRRLHVAVAGDGELRNALATRAAQAAGPGSSPLLTLLGRVPEERLPDLYRAASIFVLPTRSLEGFGMVTVEALASGLPVVATDAGATTELLADTPAGRLVAAGDPGALATALDGWLEDEAGRAAAGRAARAHAETRFTWERHLAAVEDAAARAGAPA